MTKRGLRQLAIACLCGLGFANAPLPAQRPKTAAAALEAFAAVADRSEAERRRAVPALGDFADATVTGLLLRELDRATEPGYRVDLLRALGKVERSNATEGLVAALQTDTNPRLLDAAAAALATQGGPGIAALIEVVAAPPPKGPGVDRSRRTAALTALGNSPLPEARARLCSEAKSASGRDRLPALRALAGALADAAVDALRLELAADKDVAVAACALQQLALHAHPEAATAALALHRRGLEVDAEAHTAILHGLLVAPTEATFGALLAHGAVADDPIGKVRQDLWQRLLPVAAFAQFLATTGAGSRNGDERRLTAELLGQLPAALAAIAMDGLDTMLQKPPSPKDDDVVVAAVIEALRRHGGDASATRLRRLVDKGSEVQAAMALQALHESVAGDPTWLATLVTHAESPRPQLRAAALALLAQVEPPPIAALPQALAGLQHARWQVRAAAIRLCAVLRQREAVPALIERLADAELRLSADARRALREITLRDLGDQKAWSSWWRKDGATFTVPEPPPVARTADPVRSADQHATVTYWNIPVTSDRLTFIVDTSGSMNQPFGTGGSTRLEEARRQLERAIGQLPPRARCNLIAFAGDATAFADRLQPVDKRRREAILTMAQGFAARGPTNLHAALQLAFADAEVDTMFVLTDGRPSTGPIVDEVALAAAVRQWNQGRGVAIHTIALGGKSNLLEQLARESGGEHTVAR